MKGSYRLGTFFGIGVYLHFTFLLLLGFIGWVEYSTSGSIVAALGMLLFLVALFTCLIMHEYGHALTARKFGIKTKDITLLPIGGVARLERMPDKPWQEFLVAIAGPMVNVVIAGIIVVAMSMIYSFEAIRAALTPIMGLTDSFWVNLAKVNIFLVLFNMLPAFPMDGGRIVRSLLAMVLPYERATSLAATMGKVMAALFLLEVFGFNTIPFIYGNSNILLAFIAVFVWMSAGSESRYVAMRSRLHNVPVARAMVTNFRTLSPRDTVEWVSDLAASGLQQDFPVADEGSVVGMVYRADLLAAATRREPYLTIGDIMRKDVPQVASTDMLEDIFPTVIASRHPIIPVTNRGLLVGLLPIERLAQVPPNGDRPSAQSSQATAP